MSWTVRVRTYCKLHSFSLRWAWTIMPNATCRRLAFQLIPPSCALNSSKLLLLSVSKEIKNNLPRCWLHSLS